MYRASYQHLQFFPLIERGKLTLALNGEVGIGRSPMATRMLPFFKNFYAGGIGSVRGFESGSLGPRDPLATSGDPVGGDTRLVANAELMFPVPGMGMDKSLRLSVFVDAGNVWGPNKFSIDSAPLMGDYSTAPEWPWRGIHRWVR
jgi:outer membrane protein insertion porin family